MTKPPIIRSDDLRAENRHRILDVLRKHGASTRSDLSNKSGLSPATISTLTSALGNEGTIVSDHSLPNNGIDNKAENHAGRRGRPEHTLKLDPMAAVVINAIFTIDRLQVRLLDYRGDELTATQEEFQSQQLSQDELLKKLSTAMDSVLAASNIKNIQSRLQHIGVGFQGTTEHASGKVLYSPIISVDDFPLGEYLEQRYAVPVSVQNDCRLMAKALHHSHSETLGNTFATVLFSHGIGLGLYIDGKPFSGHASSALEIGHLPFQREGALCRCGRKGCVEAYAADYGIKRLHAGKRIDDQPLGRVPVETLNEIIQAAMDGEQSAIQSFAIAGAAVGDGLSRLFTLLDPMPVVVLGRSQDGLELMRPALQETLNSNLRKSQQTMNSATIHCFDEADPWLLRGLALDSLMTVDRGFAFNKMGVRDAS